MNAIRFIRYTGPTVAVVAIGALCGCDNAPTRVEPPPPKVTVQHPELRQIVDYDQYNGWLRASDTVDIRARVRGHLDKIHFTDGDMVKKGQLLFELDPRPFQAEIGRAVDQVKIYRAQLVAAAKEEARFRELVQKGGASQSQVDMAEAETQSLEAQIEGGQQEVRRRELDLEYARITSPLTGRIGRALLSAGSLVNAAGTEDVLATVVTVDPIYVYFNIDERSLQRYTDSRRSSEAQALPSLRDLKIPFTFKLDTDNDYVRQGVLDFADNRVDSSTGTIELRGSVKNDKGLFISGSRVSIRVPVTEEHQVILIPDTSILTDQNRKYLLTLDDKKVVQRRDVELGKLLDDGMRVIRTSGEGPAAIKPEDWVITQGLQMARINYPVEPVMPPATTTQPAAPAAAAP
jgi:RND family efflux transporter MFP subunit